MLTSISLEQRLGYAVPFKIDRYHINVAIKDQLATTQVGLLTKKS